MTEQLRCVAGDQAWVIKAESQSGLDISYMLWQEVSVMWRVFPPYAIDKRGRRHQVKAGRPSWMIAFKEELRLPARDVYGNWCTVASQYAVFSDCNLMPIRPEPDPEEDHYTEGLPQCPEVV